VIGIYSITNKFNGKTYIGQSININNRLTRHRYQLNSGTHPNCCLQRAWIKYGCDNFEFKVVLECNKSELDVMEEIHASAMSNIYNITKDFTSRCGNKNPFFGRRHTKKSKNKMSKSKSGKYVGAKNPNYGGKNRNIVSALMTGSKNCNAKL
jgi:group I intron endonuclease